MMLDLWLCRSQVHWRAGRLDEALENLHRAEALLDTHETLPVSNLERDILRTLIEASQGWVEDGPARLYHLRSQLSALGHGTSSILGRLLAEAERTSD